MSKYCGKIGFATYPESRPGVYAEEIVERPYFGDITRNQRKWDSSQGQNDDLNVDNVISIVSDPYAAQNFHMIRYATFMGGKWKVRNVEVQRPRLILTLGGVYNDQAVGT